MQRRSVTVQVNSRRANDDAHVWLTIRKLGKGRGKGTLVVQTLISEPGAALDGDIEVEVSGPQVNVQFNTATHEVSARATAESIDTCIAECEDVEPENEGQAGPPAAT